MKILTAPMLPDDGFFPPTRPLERGSEDWTLGKGKDEPTCFHPPSILKGAKVKILPQSLPLPVDTGQLWRSLKSSPPGLWISGKKGDSNESLVWHVSCRELLLSVSPSPPFLYLQSTPFCGVSVYGENSKRATNVIYVHTGPWSSRWESEGTLLRRRVFGNVGGI